MHQATSCGKKQWQIVKSSRGKLKLIWSVFILSLLLLPPPSNLPSMQTAMISFLLALVRSRLFLSLLWSLRTAVKFQSRTSGFDSRMQGVLLEFLLCFCSVEVVDLRWHQVVFWVAPPHAMNADSAILSTYINTKIYCITSNTSTTGTDIFCNKKAEERSPVGLYSINKNMSSCSVQE